MSDSLIDRLRNNNKANANNLIQPKNVNLNLEEYFNTTLQDLKNSSFNENELKFIINNINNAIEYSKKTIKNK
ncbi:hypothetical protein [Clostridium ihumii]|uniref:hypothetical protein n=1 Tax=Clostridium ihumii TaxID=1470356 RepID=UPI00058CA3B2|nr:hypothetical protein [Clostridium ihumii]